jgi:hypothetical protein
MRRCTIAVDPGFTVNLKGTAASLMSAAHDGFGVVFRAALHVENGAIKESNWHDYKWTRIYDSAPEISVHILPNTQAQPGGIGELGIPCCLGGRGQRLGPSHRQAGPQLPDQRVWSLIAMPVITFNLNGKPVSVDADKDEELLWADRLGVHGPKYGCGMGLDGVCTSLVDGKAVRTCITPVGSVGTLLRHLRLRLRETRLFALIGRKATGRSGCGAGGSGSRQRASGPGAR